MPHTARKVSSPLQLHLRRACPGDAPAMAHCVSAAYTHWVQIIGQKPWPMLQDYASILETEHVVVAEIEGEIAGILVLSETPDGLLIDNVAVFPRHKGQGVGKALLLHAEVEAAARGHVSMYLYTNEKMSENIALYIKIGYIEYERRQEDGFRRVYLRKALR
jgi:ribosomal protein S18 acetylase RimI-like enzyme